MWSFLGWNQSTENTQTVCNVSGDGGVHTCHCFFFFFRCLDSTKKRSFATVFNILCIYTIKTRFYGCHASYILKHIISPSCQKFLFSDVKQFDWPIPNDTMNRIYQYIKVSHTQGWYQHGKLRHVTLLSYELCRFLIR